LVDVLLATIKPETFYFLSSLYSSLCEDESDIFLDGIKCNISFFGFEEFNVTVGLSSIGEKNKIVFTMGIFLIYFAK